jgi:hypothetical protein
MLKLHHCSNQSYSSENVTNKKMGKPRFLPLRAQTRRRSRTILFLYSTEGPTYDSVWAGCETDKESWVISVSIKPPGWHNQTHIVEKPARTIDTVATSRASGISSLESMDEASP